MNLITFLILFPLIPAIIIRLIPSERVRTSTVLISVVIIAAASIYLAFSSLQSGCQYFKLPFKNAGTLITVAEIVLAVAFLFFCRRLPFRKMWIPVIILIQYIPVQYFELSGKVPVPVNYLILDNLSIIMALLIGIIGGLITVYTVGYMPRYHKEHPEYKDRTSVFISTIFLFFFAMFGIVFSNSLSWIYFFWEVTTLCSFIMIGYTRTDEAVDNSFRALWMLLLGGMGFSVAIVYCSLNKSIGTIELSQITAMTNPVVMFPVVLLCFAGMNKAAQFPFSQWLLGAMVAPTPSSALLHSSTMVKAGVYLCIRCAPVLHNTSSGTTIALIGGITFVIASAIAASLSHGKKVLAYSTIANLGLIILCAGVGSSLAIWAALMLIIFHAVAKALMFLCVGTVDQQTGSLDIEKMRGLISTMPQLTLMILIGIAGMFLAPFGMLISKWVVLEALAEKNPFLILTVVFGGALMMFFWGKWMGTLVAVTGKHINKEKGTGIYEWAALYPLTILTIGTCVLFPVVAVYFIHPYIMTIYPGFIGDPLFHHDNIIMVLIMLGFVIFLPLGFLVHWKKLHYSVPYLGGANVHDPERFMGSMGESREWHLGNYYLNDIFNEQKLLLPANIVTLLIILIMIIAVII